MGWHRLFVDQSFVSLSRHPTLSLDSILFESHSRWETRIRFDFRLPNRKGRADSRKKRFEKLALLHIQSYIFHALAFGKRFGSKQWFIVVFADPVPSLAWQVPLTNDWPSMTNKTTDTFNLFIFLLLLSFFVYFFFYFLCCSCFHTIAVDSSIACLRSTASSSICISIIWSVVAFDDQFFFRLNQFVLLKYRKLIHMFRYSWEVDGSGCHCRWRRRLFVDYFLCRLWPICLAPSSLSLSSLFIHEIFSISIEIDWKELLPSTLKMNERETFQSKLEVKRGRVREKVIEFSGFMRRCRALYFIEHEWQQYHRFSFLLYSVRFRTPIRSISLPVDENRTKA